MLAVIRAEFRAGQHEFLLGEALREGGDQFRQLRRRQFLGIRRGERAEVKISSAIRAGNFRRAQTGRINLRVKFRWCEREAGFFQTAAALQINRLLGERVRDMRGEHLFP